MQLFTYDKSREPTIIAFGLKPSGKIYHFFNGKPYDEIKGASNFSIGNLSYYTVTVTGKHNDRIIISGGIKNGKYQKNNYSLDFDIDSHS